MALALAMSMDEGGGGGVDNNDSGQAAGISPADNNSNSNKDKDKDTDSDAVGVGGASCFPTDEEVGAVGDMAPQSTWLTGRHLYELVAVSNQHGALSSGHYTAFTKRGQHWFRCDDSAIKEVRARDVRTASAYLLFYRRVENVGAYLQSLVDKARLPRPSPSAGTSEVVLRARAWRARRVLLARAKAEEDARVAAEAARREAKRLADATRGLQTATETFGAKIEQAKVDGDAAPINTAALAAFQQEFASAIQAGVVDEEVVGAAEAAVADANKLIQQYNSAMATLSEAELKDLITVGCLLGWLVGLCTHELARCFVCLVFCFCVYCWCWCWFWSCKWIAIWMGFELLPLPLALTLALTLALALALALTLALTFQFDFELASAIYSGCSC